MRSLNSEIFSPKGPEGKRNAPNGSEGIAHAAKLSASGGIMQVDRGLLQKPHNSLMIQDPRAYCRRRGLLQKPHNSWMLQGPDGILPEERGPNAEVSAGYMMLFCPKVRERKGSGRDMPSVNGVYHSEILHSIINDMSDRHQRTHNFFPHEQVNTWKQKKYCPHKGLLMPGWPGRKRAAP
jgi:hypothetical protein